LSTVLPSCYRHDFAYRNYKKQLRFDEISKERIDRNFKSDMYRQCESEWSEHVCKMAATIYYEAVKAFGDTEATLHVKEMKLALWALKTLQERQVQIRGIKALEA